MHNLANEYLLATIRRFKYYRELGEKTFQQLDEKDFSWQPSSESNSIAVIIQHMGGNMLSRWTNFLTEDGEKDWRNRDQEFEDLFFSRIMLVDLWTTAWDCLFEALWSLSTEDLLRTVYIRKEPMTVVDAINRQLAHYAYHVGQIVYVGKLIKNEAWKNLSIPKGGSMQYNLSNEIKDPAKRIEVK